MKNTLLLAALAATSSAAQAQAKQFQSSMVADVVANPNGRIDNLKDMITTVRSLP